jgi:hypothetical protein
MQFTPDPLPQTLQQSAKDAVALGLLQPPKQLFKIYDLKPLNSVLRAEGKPEVTVKQVKIPAAESAAATTATTATTAPGAK